MPTCNKGCGDDHDDTSEDHTHVKMEADVTEEVMKDVIPVGDEIIEKAGL